MLKMLRRPVLGCSKRTSSMLHCTESLIEEARGNSVHDEISKVSEKSIVFIDDLLLKDKHILNDVAGYVR